MLGPSLESVLQLALACRQKMHISGVSVSVQQRCEWGDRSLAERCERGGARSGGDAKRFAGGDQRGTSCNKGGSESNGRRGEVGHKKVQ